MLSSRNSTDKLVEGHKAVAAAESLQSCPTLCDPTDGSPPGTPVAGILQARTQEWVAIFLSNAWKWKVKVKSLSCVRFSNPMDHSLPGSSVHGIFQARVLEWDREGWILTNTNQAGVTVWLLPLTLFSRKNAVILQMEIYLDKHWRWIPSCPTPQPQICTEGWESARGHFASSHWGSEKERNTPQGILDVRAIWPWHLSLVRSQGGWALADWPGRSLLLPISWSHVLCQIIWLSGKGKKKNVSDDPVCLMTCLGTVQKLSKNFLSQ